MTQFPSGDPVKRTVTTEQLQANFDALMAAVENEGVHVCITRDEYPVAVLMPWEHYRAAREGLARLELAYWHAWAHPERFDNDHLRKTVADLVEGRPTSPARTPTRRTSGGEDVPTAPPARDA